MDNSDAPVGTPTGASGLFNIHNLILLRTFRRFECEYVASFLLHQSRTQGRKVRYFALLHIGFRGAHDLIRMLFFFTLLLDGDDRAKRNGVAFRVFDDARVREVLFDDPNAVVGRSLQVARLLVLGVLR